MRAPQRRHPAGRRIAAHRWFFPAALALALAAIPLWTAAYAGWSAWPPLASSWHGHEMLFGCAQTVVAGFLGLMLAVDLVTLLLVLMGGRIIPAATAGALHRRGQQLRSRVQAGLERATLASLMIVIVSDLLSLWGVAAAGALVAGVLTTLRLARWRTVAIRDQPALWTLHLGYAWLALGLLAKGIGSLIDRELLIDLQHALTIGGLGTLSQVMILRTSAARRVPAVAAPRALGMIAILITLATLARPAAPFLDGPAGVWALLAAAALWSIGAAAVLALHLALAR